MADKDRGQDEAVPVDVYLNNIKEYIRVLQELKKQFPHLAIGATDLIQTLRQLQKDFMLVKLPDREADVKKTDEGKGVMPP